MDPPPLTPTPIVELGVADAYSILSSASASPICRPWTPSRNEDWGRDFLLSKFLEIPPQLLAEAGLSSRNLSDAIALASLGGLSPRM